MIVAAGFGTRLAPLSDELPKPAVPVANRPLAWFALDHLYRSGLRDFVVNTHHLAERLRAALEGLCPADAALDFVHEPSILGTGGGVRNAWRAPRDEPFVVMNGKLLFAPDLAAALATHRAHGALATLVLRPLGPGERFAAVEIDTEGRVRRIRGAPARDTAGLTPWVFTGLQILEPRAHADLPESGDVFDGAYQGWLERGEIIAAHVEHAPWRDLGVTVQHYWDANMALCDGREHWPGITPDAQHNLIHPSASVAADARITRCVIGPGCRVLAGSRIEDSVLWSGVEAQGELQRLVLTTEGRRVEIQSAP
jgi:mannose-1-phosphate guanylyltransferase